MPRLFLLRFLADHFAGRGTTKVTHGRWVGKPKPPDLAHIAPVRILDAAGQQPS